jgi:hypothetical protein
MSELSSPPITLAVHVLSQPFERYYCRFWEPFVEPFVPFVIHFIPFVIFIKCLYDPKLLFKLYTAIYRPFVPFVVPFVPFVPFVQFVQFSTAGLVGGKTKKQKISLLFFPPTNQKPSCSTFIHCFLANSAIHFAFH